MRAILVPEMHSAILTREEVRYLALESKDRLGLTGNVAEAIGRSPVYAAFPAYENWQVTEREATKLDHVVELSDKAQCVLKKVPHRSPAAPWHPTDLFIYRLYEVVMLYGPVFKDIAHELFGDGIMSAIECRSTSRKTKTRPACRRWNCPPNGKWLQCRNL